MHKWICMIALLTTAACQGDETVSAYGAGGQVWTLSEIDGAPFKAPATLTFPETGRIAGQAPCNRYFAQMDAPYPWFDTGPIATTRLTCPLIRTEKRFLSALEAMTESEVSGTTLILRSENGREMVFRSGG